MDVMKVMKKTGVTVIGLAILIGGVGKVVPHWFLSLPFPISVILWSWTGNEMPPCEYIIIVKVSTTFSALLHLTTWLIASYFMQL